MQTIVIIDGNNLAQIKYDLHGRPVTIEYDRLIIRDLSAWAKRQQETCIVDLFLDPRMVLPESSERVFVHIANSGEKADPHIKDYVRHCVMSNKPCIVISDDGDLKEYSNKQAVDWINVSEFIKFPNFLNLSPADFDIRTYPYINNRKNQQTGSDNTIRVAKNASSNIPQKNNRIAASELLLIHQKTYQSQNIKAGIEPEQVAEIPKTDSDPVLRTIQMVKLNLETWPLEDGYRFLTEMICPQHKKEYQSLLGKPKDASQADLCTYYHFMLEICGSEQDFYGRGNSLMDKIRIKLMEVYPDGVEIAELGRLFKDHNGFQHKIDVHAGKSIELFEIIQPDGTQPAKNAH